MIKPSRALTAVQQLKISCLERGIEITQGTKEKISRGGTVPLTIHEYVTTGGITMELPGNIFINAPFAWIS